MLTNLQRRQSVALRGAASAVALGVVAAAVATPALAYEEREFVAPHLKRPVKGTKVDVGASRIIYNDKTGEAIATGRVEIQYGPYTLTASKVHYNKKTGAFSANGSIVMTEPNGNRIMAAEFDLHNKFRDGFAKHLIALLSNDARITARYAKRRDGQFTVYEDATYTACGECTRANGEPLWWIETDETLHDEKGQTLYHKNPRLKVAGVTVAALPYLEHPDPRVKRRSGWLIPQAHKGKAFGVGVRTPYFWAPAQNWDVTIQPMWTIYQGPVADAEVRYATKQGILSVRGAGVYQFRDRPDPQDHTWRGAVRAKGDFKANEDWAYGFDATLASDRNFLDGYDIDNRTISENRAYATGLWDRTYISAQALNYQPLTTGISSDRLPTALPFVTGDHAISNDVWGELDLAWSAYSVRRDEAYEATAIADHGTTQSRAVADLSWKKQLLFGTGQVVTPFARLRTDVTIADELPDASFASGFREKENTSRFLPSAGFDARWPFIASHEWGQSIVSPVFQFIAATDETDREKIGNEDSISLNFDHSSLFLEDRFTGYDRYEGGTRVNAGLTYSFLADNGGFLRASAGESFHIGGKNSFDGKSGLDGQKSDLVGALTFQPWEELNLSYEIRAEEDLSAIHRQEARLGLSFDSFSGQLSYIKLDAEPLYGRKDSVHAASADTRTYLTNGWYLLSGLSYDFNDQEIRQVKTGFEFDCSCMNFKAAYTMSRPKDASTDHRVMFSVDFATLGGTKASFGF